MDGPCSDPPRIVPSAEHSMSRGAISINAVKVLNRLSEAGYEAFLVGGSVRDSLLNNSPKDFDVATNAYPEKVHELFRNSRLIGRRFRLVHVRFGREVIEVATFRAPPEGGSGRTDHVLDGSGRILRDNVYGTIEDDAWRRDFTVNALYYDARDDSILDYVGGLADIDRRVLRLIGDPATRYREDPVRMLRAVRFINKNGFSFDTDNERTLKASAPLIANVPPARLFDEMLKLFLNGHALDNYQLLRRYGLFSQLFPWTGELLATDESQSRFIEQSLINTDRRINDGQPVTPAFLFGALLWAPIKTFAAWRESDGVPAAQALRQAALDIGSQQQTRIAVPRRFKQPMVEICEIQARLNQRSGKRPLRLLGHPRFRAACDFLLLRAQVGEADQELAEWWAAFRAEHKDEVAGPASTNRRRRRGGRRNATDGNAGNEKDSGE